MRILQVVHQYPPEHRSGTELYTQSLAGALAQRGHEVTVFYRRSAEGAGQALSSDGAARLWAAWSGRVTPTRRFLATFGATALARAFERALDESQPELVHVQHLMGLPTAIARSIRRRGLPMVITLHDYWWMCANAQLLTNDQGRICGEPRGYLDCARCALARAGQPAPWAARLALAPALAWRNHMLRRILCSAASLIAPSAFVAEWYTSHGMPRAKLVVIPHGIAFPEPFAKQPHGLPMRFAYLGGIAPSKGVHVIVQAFREVKGAAELWIAGDESTIPEYAQQLRAETGPNVRFLGSLSRAQVWQTLAQVDALLVPSLWYETFSLVAHEAFAAGVPVIASRLGTLAEAVRDGVDGRLVAPGDVQAWAAVLQSCVDEPAQLARWAANVRPPLTLAQHVETVEAQYRRVLAKTRP